MDWLSWGGGAPILGLCGGLIMGLAARRARFCTLGAIEDAMYGHDLTRLRMWAAALAVAIGGTFLLAEAGIVRLDLSIYAANAWNPWASVIGGLTFGYGMAIAGNCGYGALARLGGGDLRSLVIVVVMGIAAYAVMSGPLSELRVFLFPVDGTDQPDARGYAHVVADTLGVPTWIPALVASGCLLAWAFSGGPGWRKVTPLLWAMAVGLAIVSGWVGTSYLYEHSFDLVTVGSHSFTAPVGETLLFAMTGQGVAPSFAIGSVTGVVLGAAIGCMSRGHFRWEACDDPNELGRQILGGVLMGIGGVIALGCSVGQGLTAFSALSFSAPVVLASIFVGAALGLRQLIRGFEPT